jgi:type IV pilus assembly protein PilE
MTLVELLVVVAIAAILAFAAVPSYRTYAMRAHRVEAATGLLALSAAQEKFYLQNNRYSTELADAPPDGLGMQAVTESGYYDIEIDSADAAGFTATATAKGGQADDTHCATFMIDHTGARSATSTDCWSR